MLRELRVCTLFYRQAWNVRWPKFRIHIQCEIDTHYLDGEVSAIDRVQMFSDNCCSAVCP